MKKFLILLFILCVPVIFGYESCTIDDDDMVAFAIKTTAKEIGCEAAGLPPDVDFALRNLYTLSVSGQLSPEALKRITKELKKKLKARPTLIDSMVELVELIGGTVIDGNITDLVDVPDSFLKAISTGYVRGFELCGDD